MEQKIFPGEGGWLESVNFFNKETECIEFFLFYFICFFGGGGGRGGGCYTQSRAPGCMTSCAASDGGG